MASDESPESLFPVQRRKGIFDYVEKRDVVGLRRELAGLRSFSRARLLAERRNGKTALHRAAEMDSVEVLEALIEAGGW